MQSKVKPNDHVDPFSASIFVDLYCNLQPADFLWRRVSLTTRFPTQARTTTRASFRPPFPAIYSAIWSPQTGSSLESGDPLPDPSSRRHAALFLLLIFVDFQCNLGPEGLSNYRAFFHQKIITQPPRSNAASTALSRSKKVTTRSGGNAFFSDPRSYLAVNVFYGGSHHCRGRGLSGRVAGPTSSTRR